MLGVRTLISFAHRSRRGRVAVRASCARLALDQRFSQSFERCDLCFVVARPGAAQRDVEGAAACDGTKRPFVRKIALALVIASSHQRGELCFRRDGLPLIVGARLNRYALHILERLMQGKRLAGADTNVIRTIRRRNACFRRGLGAPGAGDRSCSVQRAARSAAAGARGPGSARTRARQPPRRHLCCMAASAPSETLMGARADWACPQCTCINPASVRMCDACEFCPPWNCPRCMLAASLVRARRRGRSPHVIWALFLYFLRLAQVHTRTCRPQLRAGRAATT